MTISLYELKPRFQQMLRPLLEGLARAGVTPNQVTVAACVLCLGYTGLLALHPGQHLLWLGVPLLLFVRMALNAVDGMLAQHTGNKTALGALLNETCDQVADISVALPFLLAAGVHTGIGVAAIITALLAEFAGVSATLIGVARRFDGPMGKSDRAFAYSLAALCLAWGWSPLWVNAILGLIAALSLVTVVVRLRQALKACARATP
jgi:CDP-diacylglycerol--glycerol-3-phosphate 3-phosphatidyltransferase